MRDLSIDEVIALENKGICEVVDFGNAPRYIVFFEDMVYVRRGKRYEFLEPLSDWYRDIRK